MLPPKVCPPASCLKLLHMLDFVSRIFQMLYPEYTFLGFGGGCYDTACTYLLQLGTIPHDLILWSLIVAKPILNPNLHRMDSDCDEGVGPELTKIEAKVNSSKIIESSYNLKLVCSHLILLFGPFAGAAHVHY